MALDKELGKVKAISTCHMSSPPPHLFTFTPFTFTRKEEPLMTQSSETRQAQLVLDSLPDGEFKSKVIEQCTERARLFERLYEIEKTNQHRLNSGDIVTALYEQTLPLIYANKFHEAHLKIIEVKRRYQLLSPITGDNS